jgi:hypothetical protein
MKDKISLLVMSVFVYICKLSSNTSEDKQIVLKEEIQQTGYKVLRTISARSSQNWQWCFMLSEMSLPSLDLRFAVLCYNITYKIKTHV